MIDDPLSVDGLLALAGIQAPTDQLRARMSDSIAAGKRIWATKPAITLSQHNERLAPIKKASENLVKALEDLRDEGGEPYHSFWHGGGFADDVPFGVTDLVANIGAVATVAMDAARESKGEGRPFDHRKQNVVDHALMILVYLFKNNGVQFRINENPDGRFAAFARALFEVVTEIDPLEPGSGIDKQLARAAANLPAWLTESPPKSNDLSA